MRACRILACNALAFAAQSASYLKSHHTQRSLFVSARKVACSAIASQVSPSALHSASTHPLLPAHSCDSTAVASVHSMPPPASARLKLFSTLFSTTAL